MTAASGVRAGFGRSVAGTAVTNVVSAATAAVAGIILARALGPTVRGEYAAVVAWFAVVLVLGELGQTAATTYYVARVPYRAAEYLATARIAMLRTGSVALVAGIVFAPLLAGGQGELAWGYRLMFATCLVSFIGAAYVFALQSVHVTHWNLTRAVQPIVFLAAIAVLAAIGRLSLLTALGALAVTIIVQTLMAQAFAGRHGLTGGQRHRALRGELRRYGLAQLAATAPGLVVARLDQLLLSLFAAPAALGHYAIAVSLTTVAVPLVSAAGSVAFPRLAGGGPRPDGRLPRQAVLASLVVGLAVMVPLAALAPWLVPAVLGDGYRDSVPLVLLLAPAGVLLPAAQVCGDLLRGYGRPLDVARAQILGAVVTVALLAFLMPPLGAAGAALATSAAAAATTYILLRRLRTAAGSSAASASPIPRQSARKAVKAPRALRPYRSGDWPPPASVPVSVIVLTRDEAVNIAHCLASAAWAEQVLVVDSGSVDDTVARACKAGAEVVVERWRGFGPQREYALRLPQLRHDWVYILDADEWVSPELAAEIAERLAADRDYAAYRQRWRLIFQGRWIRHCGWYRGSSTIRLMNRYACRYPNDAYSERPLIAGNVGVLHNDVVDEDRKGLARWLTKHIGYAELEAQRRGVSMSAADRWRAFRSIRPTDIRPLPRAIAKDLVFPLIPARPLAMFLYMYVLRLGFLDGVTGLRFCLFHAWYQLTIEAMQRPEATPAPTSSASAPAVR